MSIDFYISLVAFLSFKENKNRIDQSALILDRFCALQKKQQKLAKRNHITTFKSLNTKFIVNDEMHKFYKQNVLKEDDSKTK